jgi:hypothetical protein
VPVQPIFNRPLLSYETSSVRSSTEPTSRHVIIPYFLTNTYVGERLFLPMIDVKFTKENALPLYVWGLLNEAWKPAPEDGVTVFVQALEKRGPDNRRKRIFMSALTPDLYRPMYGNKVEQFFDKILGIRASFQRDNLRRHF